MNFWKLLISVSLYGHESLNTGVFGSCKSYDKGGNQNCSFAWLLKSNFGLQLFWEKYFTRLVSPLNLKLTKWKRAIVYGESRWKTEEPFTSISIIYLVERYQQTRNEWLSFILLKDIDATNTLSICRNRLSRIYQYKDSKLAGRQKLRKVPNKLPPTSRVTYNIVTRGSFCTVGKSTTLLEPQPLQLLAGYVSNNALVGVKYCLDCKVLYAGRRERFGHIVFFCSGHRAPSLL